MKKLAALSLMLFFSGIAPVFSYQTQEAGVQKIPLSSCFVFPDVSALTVNEITFPALDISNIAFGLDYEMQYYKDDYLPSFLRMRYAFDENGAKPLSGSWANLFFVDLDFTGTWELHYVKRSTSLLVITDSYGQVTQKEIMETEEVKSSLAANRKEKTLAAKLSVDQRNWDFEGGSAEGAAEKIVSILEGKKAGILADIQAQAARFIASEQLMVCK